jgi:cytochrome P450
VIFTDGPAWKEQRRFTLRHLRDFGFGRRSMETLIHEEARALLDVVGASSHEPTFDVLPLLPVLSINILWTIMAGTRHEITDRKFVRLTDAVMSFFRSGNALDVVNFYPFLQHVPGINAGFKRQTRAVSDIQTFIEVRNMAYVCI